MSAPPLPDVFGNYVLGDFVEVVSPDAVSWLPQTAGWLWLGVILLVLLTRYTGKRLLQWYRNRYRREAARRLQQLASSPNSDELLMELNRLLKLTAIAAFSRQQVARLSGNEWVEFLNNQCATPPFSEDHGQLLSRGVYNSACAGENTLQLLAACSNWIQQHERSPDA